MQPSTLEYNAMQLSTLEYNAMQPSTLEYNAMQPSTRVAKGKSNFNADTIFSLRCGLNYIFCVRILISAKKNKII